jgi:hypothetical protein
MPKTRAAEVIKAAEKAQRADRRVSAAQKALSLAVRARDKAEAKYMQLVAESFARQPMTGPLGREGADAQASA